MSYAKGSMIYEGKAKRIFQVIGEEQLVWVEFKDSMTAFNAQKKEELHDKGKINCQTASLIFSHLKAKDIPSHWVETLSDTEMICEKLDMIDLEVVVRNVVAGSLAKKFDFEEGAPLDQPLTEFFYKKDELNDPFISDEQALMLKVVASQNDLDQLKKQALVINSILQELFLSVGIKLVDFKIEFGRKSDGTLCLGDEISADSCRLWDVQTSEKLDKDRFRRDLGNVMEKYQYILDQLSQRLGGKK